MAELLLFQKNNLDIEKALENLNWNTAKFETELAIFTGVQSPRTQHRLWKQYVDWMCQCGCPMELIQE